MAARGAYDNPDLLNGSGIDLVPRPRALALGERLETHLAAGRIRPIVGRRASDRDLPAEPERMERGETMGQTNLDRATD